MHLNCPASAPGRRNEAAAGKRHEAPGVPSPGEEKMTKGKSLTRQGAGAARDRRIEAVGRTGATDKKRVRMNAPPTPTERQNYGYRTGRPGRLHR